MRPAVGTKIARTGFVEKGEGSFANRAEIGEHGFFFGVERGIERNGRFAAKDAKLDQEKRDVESAKERDGPRSVANDAVSGAEDGTLDLAEMSDDFGGGPASIGVTERPLQWRNLFGGG